LGGFFAQKKRWLDLKHWGLLRDIVRFNRIAQSKLARGELTNDVSLGELVKECGASQYFADNYLVPMVAAIWSKSETASLAMPARFFASFFKNHGLLSLTDRPQWHVITGGSKNYIPALTAKYEQAIRLNSPVERVIRDSNRVGVVVNGEVHWFDHLILACHSDQALAMIEQPTKAEAEVLGAIEYQDNAVVLHTDVSLLPEERTTWSSWNYLLNRDHQRAVLTYNMNILQGLAPKDGTTFCVTLNDTAAIDPDKILGQFQYAHPVFNHAAVEAQGRWEDINAVANISFCGAYWRNGFHEDGVFSALRVAQNLRANLLPQYQAIASA
jgi:predicted NAD/FAD-binding protein